MTAKPRSTCTMSAPSSRVSTCKPSAPGGSPKRSRLMGPPLPGTNVKSESLTTLTISSAAMLCVMRSASANSSDAEPTPYHILLIDGVVHLDGYGLRRAVS